MNQVRTEDLLKYYQYQQKRRIDEKALRKINYDIHTEEYESKFLNKLFGWKYKDSAAGFSEYESNNSWIYMNHDDFYKDMIAECTYNTKLNFMYMELPVRSNPFYQWAADNNIPVYNLHILPTML